MNQYFFCRYYLLSSQKQFQALSNRLFFEISKFCKLVHHEAVSLIFIGLFGVKTFKVFVKKVYNISKSERSSYSG